MTSHSSSERQEAATATATLSPKSRRAALLIGLALIGVTTGVLVWRMNHMLHSYTPSMISMPVQATQTGRYLSARIAHNNGKLEDSLHYTLDALKQEPNNKLLLLHAYRTALFAGDYEALVHFAQKLPRDAEPGMPPAFVESIAAFKAQDYAKAQLALNDLPAKGFSTAFQPLFRLWAQVGAKTLAEPAQLPAFAVHAGELSLLMTYHVALINEAAGKDEAAKENYATLQKGSEMLPNRIAQGLVNYLERHGRADEAKAVLAAHRRTHPEAPVVLSEEKDPKKIQPLVRNVQEGVAELLYGMASIYAGMQAEAEAIAHLRLALMLRPDMSLAHYMLGMLQEQGKHLNDAIASYHNIDKKDPIYRRAQLRLAVVEFARGNKTEAYKELDAIQKADDTSYDALLARGDLLRDQKDYREAAAAYTQALSRIPEPKAEHWHIFYARGIAYERAHSWAKAESDLLHALQLSPDQPEVMNYLGYSWLIYDKDTAKARAMLTRALAMQPENPAIIDSLGWAYYLDGKYDDARKFIEQAADLIPKDATVNGHLGDVYWRLGRETEARYQWERALLFKPEEPGEAEALRKKIDQGLPPVKAQNAAASAVPAASISHP